MPIYLQKGDTYIYIYTYIHTYIHPCMHTDRQTDIQTDIHTHNIYIYLFDFLGGYTNAIRKIQKVALRLLMVAKVETSCSFSIVSNSFWAASFIAPGKLAA